MKLSGKGAALAALTLALLLAGLAASLATDVEPVPLNKPLGMLPQRLGDWSVARADQLMDDHTLAVLGATDYLLRTYVDAKGFPCAVFVAYFDRQAEGRMIHSPLHCLPGGGWEISGRGTAELDGPHGPVAVNTLELTRDLDKLSVVYWYQGRGRIVRSEYYDRLMMAWDGLTMGRTDGALVRLMAPESPEALARQLDLGAAVSRALAEMTTAAASGE